MDVASAGANITNGVLKVDWFFHTARNYVMLIAYAKDMLQMLVVCANLLPLSIVLAVGKNMMSVMLKI